MSGALSGMAALILAAAGWILGAFVTHFVIIPLRKFWDLRGEVRQRMHEFANVRARWKEINDDPNHVEEVDLNDEEVGRLKNAEHIIRVLGTRVNLTESESRSRRMVRFM